MGPVTALAPEAAALVDVGGSGFTIWRDISDIALQPEALASAGVVLLAGLVTTLVLRRRIRAGGGEGWFLHLVTWLGVSAGLLLALATLTFGLRGLVVAGGLVWAVGALLAAPSARHAMGALASRTDGAAGRAIVIPVTVSHDSDPEQVRAMLFAIGQSYPRRAEDMRAEAAFRDISQAGLHFALRLTLADGAEIDAGEAASELRSVVVRAFREAGIEIASPQTGVRLRDLDDLRAAIGRAVAARRERDEGDE